MNYLYSLHRKDKFTGWQSTSQFFAAENSVPLSSNALAHNDSASWWQVVVVTNFNFFLLKLVNILFVVYKLSNNWVIPIKKWNNVLLNEVQSLWNLFTINSLKLFLLSQKAEKIIWAALQNFILPQRALETHHILAQNIPFFYKLSGAWTLM